MTSSAVQTALDTLIEAIRADLREEFLSALGSSSSAPTKRGRGRQAKASSKVKTRKTRTKGAKRTPEELEALTAKTLAAITKTPGQRVEELSETLGVGTKELALPVLKLFEQKSIKTTGQRRGTKYFPK
jgi:hypothetical protein